ncbi:MAG: hypothetical protein ACI9HX_000601 [Pseudoalteromonas tetraodonis]|jgi:hypothetical protein
MTYDSYVSHLHRFVKELLRERRLTVGRLEGGWTGVETDAAGETFEHDPSMSMTADRATRAIHRYLTEGLCWESDLNMRYRIFHNVHPWNHKGGDDSHSM